jgi:hypothetical protein
VDLQAIIQEYAADDFAAGKDEAVVSALNASTIDISDHDQYTWAGIALLAGPVAAEQLRLALEQNGMGWVVHQFGGTGLQITNPLVMQAIQGFIAAGIPLQDMVDQVVRFTSPAQQGLGRDVTLDDVAAYRLSILKSAKEDAAVDRLQAYREALSAWDGTGEEPVL